MNKTTVMTVMLTMLAVSFSAPKANAGIGIVTFAAATAAIGGASALGGVGVAVAATAAGAELPTALAVPLFLVEGAALIGGLVFLKDEGNSSIKFTEISEDQAKKMDLTDVQMDEYNKNIEIFNLCNDQISSTITKKTPQKQIISQWKKLLKNSNVSRDGIEGLARVSQYALKQAQ
ncbi:MAG: hypothetical protein PHY93_07255 [Bacteriovorax sp.]|nr:hypothetical protein [Bacteriovorax sp.]